MAFNLRKLNHSPQWYDAHCLAEDGGSAAFRAMLKKNMAYLAADNDPTMCYAEKVGVYGERWGAAMAGDADGNTIAEMGAVLERESESGFRPQEQFKEGGFKKIARIMANENLTAEDVRQFLKWKSKSENMEKARAGKKKVETKKEKAAREKLEKAKLIFGKKTWVPSNSDF